jgi:hypothetical protein
MGRFAKFAVGAASIALASCTAAQSNTVTTPEGAVMQVNSDLAYKPGELTQHQLMSSTRDLFAQDSMNVFRRFPRGMTEQMIKFYTEALALRSLSPIQLTSSQQMILTGVGSGQIKLSAGQQGSRKYNMEGGVKGGTGIRFFTLTYPDKATVAARFTAAGLPAPQFVAQGDGTEAASRSRSSSSRARRTVPTTVWASASTLRTWKRAAPSIASSWAWTNFRR